jgi:Uma2 family endonuclease
MAGKPRRAKPLETPKGFTYRDYLAWPDDERWEIINGEAFAMTPGPNLEHQRYLIRLATRFHQFLEGKPCEVFVAPFDVRLPNADEAEEEIRNVVQPDIMVVCDPEKLDRRGIKGAPDLVVEIVSPSTASNDYIRKLRLYEKHGVKEYWILHPADRTVLRFLLGKAGRFGDPKTFREDESIDSRILKGLSIDLPTIFASSKSAQGEKKQ